MTIEQLEDAAYKRQSIPDSLNAAQLSYFIAMRGLYDSFKSKMITKEQGAKDKKEIKKTYKILELACRIGEQNLRELRKIQKTYYQSELQCPTCKALFDSLIGFGLDTSEYIIGLSDFSHSEIEKQGTRKDE